MTPRILAFALAWFGLQTSTYSLLYLWHGPAHFDPLFRAKFTAHLTLLTLHTGAGVLALTTGLPQFLPRRPWHRALGRLYLQAVIVCALTGFPMAAMAEGGTVSRAGFFVLDTLWLATAWQAWRTARKRRFREHRAWMVRNYALTYSSVCMRMLLHGLTTAGYPFAQVYPVINWAGWLISLGMGEWWLRGTSQRARTLTLPIAQ